MPFTVQWLKNDTVVVERQFDELQNAKRGAREQLKRYRVSKGATSAIVTDAEGNIQLRVF